MLINIGWTDQSIEIETHTFFPKSIDFYQFHQFLSISSILLINEKLLILV